MNKRTALCDRFRSSVASDDSDIHSLRGLRDKALWVLAAGKDRVGESWLTAGEISNVLSEVFEEAATRQGVQAALHNSRGIVQRKRAGGRIMYSIMEPGRARLAASRADTVVIIEPEKAFSGRRAVQELLATLTGKVRICDPYVDCKTLDFIPAVPGNSEVLLLTKSPQKPGPLKRDYEAYTAEHGNLAIRVHPTARLHDRYVISDKAMYILGQSLNGIGKKQCFVVSVGPDVREQMARSFDAMWNSATELA